MSTTWVNPRTLFCHVQPRGKLSKTAARSTQDGQGHKYIDIIDIIKIVVKNIL